ncbi:uncharacterized protein [Pagrus major]|uniref:uncharacterized protein isoform X2 n=1 Tax=Pagrus major TaxID=143350 RepID=UPI003CC85BB6
MTVTAFRHKGVTVVTVASDSNSMLPPLCQILKSLCYSPTCCSVTEGLLQTNVVSALGAIMIMVGLFNIGLGPGRMSYHPEDFTRLGAAYWLGGVYIAAGVVSVLASRFPSRCLVGFAAFVNIIGSIFAIVGIVMYAIDLSESNVGWMCDWGTTDGPDRCKFVAYFAQRLLTGMDVTLIVMAVLQLCVCISFAVLGIKALRNRKVEVEGDRDVEIYQPVQTEDVLTGPGV